MLTRRSRIVSINYKLEGSLRHERIGRGRVKDHRAPAAGDRRIVVSGRLRRSEIRVLRGGAAILTAMCSREYVADVRRAHRDGGFPTVDDPTRTA